MFLANVLFELKELQHLTYDAIQCFHIRYVGNNIAQYSFFILLAVFLADLQSICTQFHNKVAKLEEDKYDLEISIMMRTLEVNLLLAEKQVPTM